MTRTIAITITVLATQATRVLTQMIFLTQVFYYLLRQTMVRYLQMTKTMMTITTLTTTTQSQTPAMRFSLLSKFFSCVFPGSVRDMFQRTRFDRDFSRDGLLLRYLYISIRGMFQKTCFDRDFSRA